MIFWFLVTSIAAPWAAKDTARTAASESKDVRMRMGSSYTAERVEIRVIDTSIDAGGRADATSST
jgi:hypothetical protein